MPSFQEAGFWRSEKYINQIRLAIIVSLSALFCFRLFVNPLYPSQQAFLSHVLALVVGWFYSVFVILKIRKKSVPRWMPWISGIVDTALITNTLISDSFSPQGRFPSPDVTISAAYGLYYLTILFSVLRHSPAISLFIAGISALSYGVSTFYFGKLSLPLGYLLTNEGYKVFFLLVAGGVAAFNARYMSKALDDAKANESRAEESDRRLKDLSANLPGAILQLLRSPDGRISTAYVSEGLRGLLALNAPTVMIDPVAFLKFMDQQSAQLTIQKFTRPYDQEITWSEEFLVHPRKDVHRWVRTIFSAKPQADGGVIFNGLMLDITDRKAVELELIDARQVAEEANKAKASFLANMSHELRTPLNAIMGLTELLLDGIGVPEQRAHLETILQSGENLLSIINDVLDFTKIEVGQLRIQKDYFSLTTLLDSLKTLFQKAAADRKITLELEYDPPLDEPVWGDPVRIRQVLVNLIGNALKFTPYGSIRIRCHWELIKGQEILLSIEVKDTGIGIPEKDLNKIFEKFTQVDGSKTRIFGGTGLGLSISRHLADLMEGKLLVKSELGQGSTFTLQLNSSFQIKRPSRAIENKERLLETLPPLRVLLVEDNEVNQDVQVRMLKKLGISVEVASGGHEALQKLQTSTFDLVFMDWQMPVMDGLETTKRIRSELPGSSRLVIIGLSGHALPGDRELLLSSGFNDYLTKPVRMADFQAVLERWAPMIQN